MKKIFLILSGILFILILLTSCGSPESQAAKNSSNKDESATSFDLEGVSNEIMNPLWTSSDPSGHLFWYRNQLRIYAYTSSDIDIEVGGAKDDKNWTNHGSIVTDGLGRYMLMYHEGDNPAKNRKQYLGHAYFKELTFKNNGDINKVYHP
jgi:hypothetical protein